MCSPRRRRNLWIKNFDVIVPISGETLQAVTIY